MFKPGPITQSQADELNDMARRLGQLERMNATAPARIQKVGGSYTFSVSIPEGSEEFDAMITDGRYLNGQQAFQELVGTRYSWVKSFWNVASGGILPSESLDWNTQGTLNLVRDASNPQFNNPNGGLVVPAIPNGSFVRIKPIPDAPGFYSTDAVGGMFGYFLFYKDWSGANVTASFYARDLLASGLAPAMAWPPPISPPPGFPPPPPAPGSGPGGG